MEFQTPSPLGVKPAEVTPEKARFPSFSFFWSMYDIKI